MGQGGKRKLADAEALIDEATKVLGDLPAPTERAMMKIVENEMP